MKESEKLRSGRAGERTVRLRPSWRREKKRCSFRDDEGVAAERDRDMVMPARVTAPLIVIEAQFAFQVLVDALRLPALLE